jgi:hypothetical protein
MGKSWYTAEDEAEEHATGHVGRQEWEALDRCARRPAVCNASLAELQQQQLGHVLNAVHLHTQLPFSELVINAVRRCQPTC